MESNMIADTLHLEAANQQQQQSVAVAKSEDQSLAAAIGSPSRVAFDYAASQLQLQQQQTATTATMTAAAGADNADNDGGTKKLMSAASDKRRSTMMLRFTWRDIVWRNVIAFIYLHGAALYGTYLLCTGHANLSTFFIGYAYGILGAMGITAGAHRHWAHKSFKAKWPLKFLLTAFNTIAFQNSIYEWVRDHRVHHKFTDTDADPHNVSRGMFFAHMGWLMIKKHPDVKTKGASIDMTDLEQDAFVMFQKKYYMWLMPLLCFGLPVLLPWYIFGESLSNSWYVGGMLRYAISLHSTWLVNSAAHIWGYKPYDGTIKSSNNIFVAVIAFGEGWHNYHHVFPWDYKTSELGDYGMNFTTAFIDFFARIGWAYDLKTVSEEMIVKRAARTGDGTNHHSRVIPPGGAKQNGARAAAEYHHQQQHHHHHHHHHDENMIWGWDDSDMAEMDRKDALIINKKDD